MTREEIAERATNLKPLNCAQSVVKALEEYIGPDAEILIKATACMGGGMGTMENSCGALNGAAIAASYGLPGREPVMKAKSVLTRFKAQCGAITCKDLKGIETGKPLCSCHDCIYNATMIALDEMGI